MSINEKLLKLIRSRKQRQTEFGYGITTADRYVRTLKECVGIDACYNFACSASVSFNDVMSKAAETLTYSNPDMILQDIYGSKEASELEGLELPKNTLMIFKHVLTTPRKDRDGDILRTEGAKVDPKMLLLWQHVHTLPIGKLLGVAEHNSKRLSLYSVIVDMNDLSHDAAVMIENKMGRFSHGFRALSFSELKEEEGEVTSPGGFDIKGFEIMEESLVSVPSNIDAETEDVLLSLVDGSKLKSKIMREVGQNIKNRRPPRVSISYREKIGDVEREIETSNAAEFEKVFGALKGTKDENQPGSGEGKGAAKEGCTCPSKETEAAAGETKEASDAEEVLTAEKNGGGPLSGSWEWIERLLGQRAKPYLQGSGVLISDGWVYVVGTFADHVIVCVEKPYCGAEDEYTYYQISWTTNDQGEPVYSGQPERVDIVTSIEMRERSPYFDQKAGRVLSARNLQVLKNVYDDLKELMDKEESMTRGSRSLCERCLKQLGDMIAAMDETDEGETSVQEVGLKQAMAVIVAKSGQEDITMLKSLIGIWERSQSYGALDELQALVG